MREICYCTECRTFKPETDFSSIARQQHRNALAACDLTSADNDTTCKACVLAMWNRRLGRDEVDSYCAEDRYRRLANTRLPNQEAMKGLHRIGVPLHSSQLIMRLQRLIPGLHVSDGGIEGDISLYRVLNNEIAFVCYTNSGDLPEFSIIAVNADNQPLHEFRGWRTVLLRLIKAGVLTEAQVDQEFGYPSAYQLAALWREQLFNHRNERTL